MAPGISIELEHAYKTPGTFQIRAMSVEVESGQKSGFGPAKTVEAIGAEAEPQYLGRMKAISSSQAGEGYAAQNILDGQDSFWRSSSQYLSKTEEWVGLRLDTHYALDTLEVKVPAGCACFPEAVSVEYTTDGGPSGIRCPSITM